MGYLRLLAICLAGLPPMASGAGETVTLGREHLVPLGPAGGYAATITLPDPEPGLPLVDPASDRPGALLLRRLAGQAAGFAGIVYDNRDRDHSALPPDLFPQLARLRYGPELRRDNLDYGLGGELLFPAIVLGNSSTAITTGPAPRSQMRLAMTMPGQPAWAWRGYVSNSVYVYPEHRDHDERDLYPANWPYMVTSQGSSGSDQPFLRALAMTLAAFTPGTRARLEAEGLVAPTLQMILRRSLRPVTSRSAYFTPIAHPPVFDADTLVPGRMVSLAAAMTPETIPPMVRVDVTQEDFTGTVRGGADDGSERLYDTPSAVARIWRGPEWEKGLTVSAARTFDPNGSALSFTWAVLRGDPDAIRIEPFGPGGAQARIRLTWQDPAAGDTPGRPPAGRIDIGVFASNGTHDSAPAILSILLPLHEGRVYGPDGSGTTGLLRRVPDATIYRDPVLFPEPAGEGEAPPPEGSVPVVQ